MTARAMGREVVDRLVGSGRGREGLAGEVRGCVEGKEGKGVLSERTRRDVDKVIKYKSTEEVDAFVASATQYAVSIPEAMNEGTALMIGSTRFGRYRSRRKTNEQPWNNDRYQRTGPHRMSPRYQSSWMMLTLSTDQAPTQPSRHRFPVLERAHRGRS